MRGFSIYPSLALILAFLTALIFSSKINMRFKQKISNAISHYDFGRKSTTMPQMSAALFIVATIMAFLAYFAFAAPLATFVSPTLENNVSTGNNWTYINITSDEDLNQSILEWGNASGFTNVSMSNLSASMTNWYINMTGLSDGTYNYTVWAENTTGEWNQTNRMFVYIDTTPPYSLYACQELTIENGSYILAQNVSSAGTCFTIKADNITLDGNGYAVNYSQLQTGYAINNSLGYDNIMINNLSIIQQNASVGSSNAIYADGMSNSSISNNTISTAGASSRGIYLTSSSGNNVSENNITTSGNSGSGLYLLSSNTNYFLSNDIRSSGTSSYGIYSFSLSSLNIVGGSIVSKIDYDYYLQSMGLTNNFTNTNFTAKRQIYFNDATSWFNYRNDSSNNLWLKTNISNSSGSSINRTLVTWSNSTMRWNDTNGTVGLTARYNITGLLPSKTYAIYNTTGNTRTKVALQDTDASGVLPSFTIALNGNTQIQVQALNLSVCGDLDLPETYNLVGNVSSAGTCFTIKENNVTLDGVGYTINYSQSVVGYAVSNIGYNFTAIKNANIVQGSNISSSIAINFFGTSNDTIQNNTITTSGANSYTIYLRSFNVTATDNTLLTSGQYGYGFYLLGSSSSNLSNNVITTSGPNGYSLLFDSNSNLNIISNNLLTTSGSDSNGVRLSSSETNTFVNNTITTSGTSGWGIYIYASNANTFLNNAINTSNTSAYGFYIYSSSSTNITDGSVIAQQSAAYYLRNAGTTNNFTNTNFTALRNITFYDVTSWFNYQNDSSQNIWLKTNASKAGSLNRTLVTWSNSTMKWNETNGTSDLTMRYNITGLLPSKTYAIYNTSGGTRTKVALQDTDASGVLPSFTIALNGETQVQVQALNLTSCGDLDLPETYNLIANVSSAGTCFEIFSDNVTIDGRGYTINHSQISKGFGVENYYSGYDYLTVKNLNIVQGNSGVSSYAFAIRGGGGMQNSTITNNTMTAFSSYARCVALFDSTTRYNTISNNNCTVSGSADSGIFFWNGPQSNLVVNNTITDTITGYSGGSIFARGGGYNNYSGNVINSDHNYGIFFESTTGVDVRGGSISGGSGYDYRLISAGTNNNFTNTNFTGMRKIYFYDNASWFNYNNETNGNIWLKTGSLTNSSGFAGASINRTLVIWSNNTMKWNDTNGTAGLTARYNLTGLLPSKTYAIYNTSAGTKTKVALQDTDASGVLPSFTIALNGNTQIQVQALNISACGDLDLPETYNLVANISSDADCFNIKSNNVTLDGAGYTINYSQSATGYAVNNTLGYNFTTIKNANIVQGNSSVASAYAIYFYGASNGTIQNNTIETSGSNSVGILLSSSSNSNILSNNAVTTSGTNAAGIDLLLSSDSNTFSNNRILTLGTSAFGVYMALSSSNNITGGSIIAANGYDYYFDTLGTTNNFTSTNFTAKRQIFFSDTNSWFNYNNETNGNIWLKNSLSAAGSINRTLSTWSNNTMKWNETPSAALTATYNLTGLLPTTTYVVYNTTGATRTRAYTKVTDASGATSFDISLTANTQIQVQALNLSVCGDLDLPETYNLVGNVSSAGTCFTIKENNVTLDGNGYTVNYSLSVLGYGVSDVGYNNMTVKNLNMKGGPAGTYSFAVRADGVKNSTITNNTISVNGDNSRCIAFFSSTSSGNMISNNTCTISGNSDAGIFLYNGPSANTIINNTVNVPSGLGVVWLGGILLYSGTASNAVIDNIINSSGNANGIYMYNANRNNLSGNLITFASGSGIKLDGSSLNNNSISGGSITGGAGYNYYLNGVGTTNNFSGVTSLATWRTYFYDNTSVFNYNNETNGNIWLKTNLTNQSGTFTGASINRTLATWSQSTMKWNDTNSTEGIAVRYSLIGLLPITTYAIYNTSGGTRTKVALQDTDASGVLPSFTIALNGETQVQVQALNLTSCGDLDLPETYNLIANVSSAGTCFTIKSNNITLDGNGYTINYSQSATGNAINNTLGYDNLTIKNLNIVQGKASVSDAYGISISGMTYGLITNNSIQTSGASSEGIALSGSSNFNNISNNTITALGSSSYSIGVFNSGSNIFTDNNMVQKGDGAYPYAIYLFGAYNNSITSGSITSSTGIAYALRTSGNNNNFTNTNFTSQRKIYFWDSTSWFNYNNETNGNIWLKTNLTNQSGTFTGASINRTLATWSQFTMKWNDTNGTAGLTARYNLTGLQQNSDYIVRNTSGGSTTRQILNSGADGALSFTIALNENTEIKAVSTNINTCQDLDEQDVTYKLIANVSSAGTCFTIKANNVTLDGAGYTTNYSQSATGYAVNNSLGFNSTIIKNMTIVQGNASNSNAYAIYFKNTANGTIVNNTITTSGIDSYGVAFDTSSSNNVSNNNITTSGNWGLGIYFLSSVSNIFSDNLLISEGSNNYGVYSTWSDSNTIINNTMNRIYLYQSNSNNIKGGSIQYYHYNTIYSTNNFTDTNFTASRTIDGDSSWFNYNNETNGNIWLKTNVSAYITRTLVTWSNNTMKWNDTNSSAGITARYNLTGIYPSTNYNATNRTSSGITSQILQTDASGNLPSFTIALDGNTEIKVADDIAPQISFSNPTPANNTYTKINSTYINTTIADAYNATAFINWNNSLVGWWRFNNESGENNTFVKDWSGYGNNGTWGNSTTGNISYVSGKFGNAIEFDGIDDYIDAGNGASLGHGQNITQLTIELWLGGIESDGWTALLDGTINNNGYEVYGVTKNQFAFLWGNGTTFDTLSNLTGIPDTSWHYYTITFNSGNVNIYRDGINIGSKSSSLTHMSISTNSLKMGRYSDTYILNGTLDEVKIWNRALSPEEINASYNAGSYRLYHNFTNTPDGVYNYTAYAQDLAGNVNQTETRAITIDTIIPTVSIISPANTTMADNSPLLSALSSDVNPNSTWYSLDSGSNATNNCDSTTCVVNLTKDWIIGSGGESWSGNATMENATKDMSGEKAVLGVIYDTFDDLSYDGWINNSVPWFDSSNFVCFGNELYYPQNFTDIAAQADVKQWNDGGPIVSVGYTEGIIRMYLFDDHPVIHSIVHYNWSSDTGNWTALNSSFTGCPSGNVCRDEFRRVGEILTAKRVYPSPMTATYNVSKYNPVYGSGSVGVHFYALGWGCFDNFRAYYPNTSTGSIISRVGDAEQESGTGSVWTQISFAGDLPENNSVDIYINTSADGLSYSGYQLVKANASANIFYRVPDSNRQRYASWKLVLNASKDSSYTPTVQRVRLGASLIDGSHIAKFFANDSAGNKNSASVTFTIDTVQPFIGFVSPTPSNDTYANNNPYINVSVSDITSPNNITGFINFNNSLVGWWRFNREAGENDTLVRDWSAYGNNGTMLNMNPGIDNCTGNCSGWTTSGKFGYGMQFDGADDYVDISDKNALDISQNLTMEAWIYPKSFSSGGVVIQKSYAYEFRIDVSGNIYWAINNVDPGWTWINTGTTVPLNQWTHVIITYNLSTINTYTNGVLKNNYSGNGSIGTSAYPLEIGHYYPGDGSWAFNGTIDEVKIWNRALSPEEINASYNAGSYRLYHNFTNTPDGVYNYTAYAQDLAGNVNQTETRIITIDTIQPSISFVSPTPEELNTVTYNNTYINVSVSDNVSPNNITAFINWNNSLVGWWRFNREAGENDTFVKDWSGYGNNGTWGNSTTGNISYVSGKFGNAIEFDGIDDYIDAGNRTSLNAISTSITIEAWTYPTSFSTDIKSIVGKYMDTNDYQLFFNGTNGAPAFFSFGLSPTTVVSTTGTSLNYWHHVAATFNSGSNVTLYLDGVMVRTVAVTGTLSTSTNKIVIGYDKYNSAARAFKGTIDEVKIWNRALSPEEINASYNAGVYRLYHNFTNTPDGIYNYTAYAQDLAGNVNQTSTKQVVLDANPPYSLYACQDLTRENGSYILAQNVSSAGTCFTIKANNVTLDGARYTVNYSQSSTGYAINNTLGYNFTTIKNATIVQGNSNVNDSVAIYGLGMNNGTILNTTVRASGLRSHGIVLNSSSSSNNVSGNSITLTGDDATGIYLYDYGNSNTIADNVVNVSGSTVSNWGVGIWLRNENDNNIVSGNNVTTYGGTNHGIWNYLISDSNKYFDNNVIAYGSLAYGFVLESSSNNNITGGSIISSSFYDYAVAYNTGGSNFTDTNFTAQRRIFFYSSVFFNYRNDTSSDIWLKTNLSNSSGVLANTYINRTLSTWSNSTMKWNDTNSSAGIIANYNLTGLQQNSDYIVRNTSASGTTRQIINSGADGVLSFAIALNGNTEIKAVSTNINICQDLDEPDVTYKLIANVSSQGTCFTIKASNVTLDGQGYWVNYSQAVIGHGVNITGVTNVTVKNAIIVLGNSSNSNTYGIVVSGTTDSTIENNIVNTSGTGNDGIALLSSSHRNIIKYNNVSSSGRALALFSTASSNSTVILQNRLTGTNSTEDNVQGISLSYGGNNNATDNYISVPGANSEGVWILSSKNNTISGGSISAASGAYGDYSIRDASEGNNFTNTNFTAVRKIYLWDNKSWFNYRNDSTNDLWLKTNISKAGWINRTLLTWSNSTMKWNDTNGTVELTARYNLTGLQTNADYIVRNTSASGTTRQILTTDAGGNLPSFTIALNGNTEIKAVSTNINICQDLDEQDAVYRLIANVSSAGTCFTIKANNVTLDGQGYTINYSQSETGYGVGNSGGYDNITIKNANIVQDNSSAAGSSNYAIYASGMTNSIINNNIISTKDGNGNGIDIRSSNNNVISNNSVTTSGTWSYPLYFQSSSTNNISNNNITRTGSTGCVVYLYSSSNFNNFTENIIKSTGDTCGVAIETAYNNSISGGSITYNTGSYNNLRSAGPTNNFTNTNFTDVRRLYWYDTGSWFNYNNETNGNIWLKTNVSKQTNMDRTLITWSNSTMKWNDTNLTSSLTAYYNITGLLASTTYAIYNTSSGTRTKVALQDTDASGVLPSFTIALNGNTQIQVQALNLSACQDLDLPETYNLVGNVSSAGTCFTIKANNVTLDGAGYTINYSQSATGSGIGNGGYDNIIIKNLNIVQGSSISNSPAIQSTEMLNSIITNNTIQASGSYGYGIQLSSSSNSNNVSDNTIITSGYLGIGIYVTISSNSNIISNNTILTSNTDAYAFALEADSFNNKIIGGSLNSGAPEYYLDRASTTNNFTNTNFSVARDIKFSYATSWFNYNNETNGNIWLKTNISAAADTITRTLITWSQSTMKWNDTNASAGITARYNLTGLIPSADYIVRNTSGGSTTRQILTTDASGVLPSFTIALNGNTEIKAVSTSINTCQDLDEENVTYKLIANVSSAGTCFTIKANNVTLDGQGYTINYSQSVNGNAVNNSLGYDDVTVKNFDIVQNNVSTPQGAMAIYYEYSQNGIIFNNTIKTYAYGAFGIYVSGGANDNVSNNYITTYNSGGYSEGIDLESSASSTVANNVIITNSSRGIYLRMYYAQNEANIISNNTVITATNAAISLYHSNGTGNNITGGSYISNIYDYSLANSSSRNNFINTNFTSLRKIWFGGVASVFNYNNETNGNIWLKTNISNSSEFIGASINRTLITWSNNTMKWNDTNSTSGITAGYNLTGLLPSKTYAIYNTSAGTRTKVALQDTDASGVLPSFTIALNGETQVQVQALNLTSCGDLDLPETYNLIANVSSAGTCFTIKSNNVTLDGQGYTINYSQEVAGNGVSDSGGYDAITIKNLNLNQGNSSISNADAITSTGMTNSTIVNNTITTIYSNGIVLYTSSNSNNVLNNSITTSGDGGGYGIYLYAADLNYVSGNNITTTGINGRGLVLDNGADSNTLFNNIVLTSHSNNGLAIYILSSNSNNITGGSLIAKADTTYYLQSGSNNNFTDTNFTALRQIVLVDSNVWFNYRNDSSSDIWLKTGGSAAVFNRTLTAWSNNTMKWNDTNSTSGITARYNLTGLLPSKTYAIYNTSGGTRTKVSLQDSDADGVLPSFTIALNGNTQIQVQALNLSACGDLDLPETYNLVGNVSSAGTCFTINANNVTLDGAGYTVNYSQITSGKGVAFTKNNVTVKNLNVVKGNSSVTVAHAIDFSGNSNNVSNNNVTTSGTNSYGISLNSGTSNLISNNIVNTTGLQGFGIVLGSVSGNKVIGNDVTASGGGTTGAIYLNGASSNELYGNIIRPASSIGYTLFGTTTQGNIIQNGSVMAVNIDYNMRWIISPTNNFTNTNFTGSRKIWFEDANTFFVYNNETNGNIWLKTNVSAANTLTRTLVMWNNNTMKWNDTNSTSGIMARYNLTGLLPSKTYAIYNTSAGTRTKVALQDTDASGVLPSFTIALNGNTQIQVQALNLSACGDLDLPEAYNLVGNVSSAGTCFTIKSDNVTLDGAGYTINYSQSATGYAIDNSLGYSFATIKNLNIVQGSTSSSSSAIYFSGANNGTIQNNTITTYGQWDYGVYFQTSGYSNITKNNIMILGQYSDGIRIFSSTTNIILNNTVTTSNTWGLGVYLQSSTTNTILNNTITTSGDSGRGVFLESSSNSNIITNNTIITSGSNGFGAYLVSSSNSNNLTNNAITTTNTSAYGIWIGSSSNNSISGGSIVAQQATAYVLGNADTTNNFTSTNFTAQRGIEFAEVTSWFNYNNQTDGNIWLKTNVSAAGSINRTLVNWNTIVMRWNDTNGTAGLIARYNITGMLPSTTYYIYNTSASTQENAYVLTSDASGNLPSFTIALNGNTEIAVGTLTMVASGASNANWAWSIPYTGDKIRLGSETYWQWTSFNNSGDGWTIPRGTETNWTWA